MAGFDLRFVIPIIINLLKSKSKARRWDWDAFSLLKPNEISWINISFHVSMSLLFSFTSITITASTRPPLNAALLHFRFGDFSPPMAVSVVCLLVFPQALFWFLYPAILVVNHFLGWINVQLSALPVWNFHVSFTLTHYQQEANTDVDPQVPEPQVNISISPEDGASVNAVHTQATVPQVNIDISPDGASIAEA